MKVDKNCQFIDNTASVTPVCHLAMNSGELGQARKGAAAADDSCAGMWLGPATQSPKVYSSVVRFVLA